MVDNVNQLKNIGYRLSGQTFGVSDEGTYKPEHPFDRRNIHPEIFIASKNLFDNEHYKQATLSAFIRIEELVTTKSKINATGWKLMMEAFDEEGPKITLNPMSNSSEKEEQKGYRHIFAGSLAAIRNPRAHSTNYPETIDECLDHLNIASALMRKIDKVQE